MTRCAWMAGCVSAAVFFGTSAAWAQQGFALDRFNPAEAGSEWFALDTLDMRGRAGPSLSLLGEVAHRPLATYGADGALRASVVENQAFLRLAGSMVVLDRVRLALSLPVAVYQSGTSDQIGGMRYAAPSSAAAVGDLRVGADARLVGEPGTAFTLAAGLQVFIPSGSRNQYTGDGSVRILPRAMAAGEVGFFAYSAQVGYQYRALSQDFGGGAVGSEVLIGCAAGVRLANRRLLIGPELFGSTVVSKASAAFSKVETPIELLIGAHYRLPAGLRIGAGGGLGLSRGFGSPQARFVASFGWEPETAAVASRAPEVAPALAEKRSGRDGDGIPGEVEAPPSAPPVRIDPPVAAQEPLAEVPDRAGKPRPEEIVSLVAALSDLEQVKTAPIDVARVEEVAGASARDSAADSESAPNPRAPSLAPHRSEAAAGPTASEDAAQADPHPGGQPDIDLSRIQRPKIDFGAPTNAAQRVRAQEGHAGLDLEGPRVRSDQVQEKPALDGKSALEPEVIAETIGKNSKAFQSCVETELRRNPGFKGGKVLITASLKPSGIVAAASINRPEVDGSTVGVCLKEKTRRIVFPAFEGEPFDVEIPLVLTSGESL